MKIICFGDSNTYGYRPDQWQGARYDAAVRWPGRLARTIEAQNPGRLARIIEAQNPGRLARTIEAQNPGRLARTIEVQDPGRLARTPDDSRSGSRARVQVVNEGQNGREIPRGPELAWTVRHLKDISEDGDVVAVMLGSNDILLGGASADETAGRMKTFLEALAAEMPGVRILLVGPVHLKPGLWSDSRTVIRESEKLPGLYEKLTTIPALERVDFADANEWGVEISFDGVHFTEEGQKAFAEGLTKALKLWYSIR